MLICDWDKDRTETGYTQYAFDNEWQEFAYCKECGVIVPIYEILMAHICKHCGYMPRCNANPYGTRYGKYVPEGKFWHISTWGTGHIEWEKREM
jgi:hypothetical protein